MPLTYIPEPARSTYGAYSRAKSAMNHGRLEIAAWWTIGTGAGNCISISPTINAIRNDWSLGSERIATLHGLHAGKGDVYV